MLCGTPRAVTKSGAPASGRDVTTIEQTSKKWKGWQLFFALLTIVGAMVVFGSAGAASRDATAPMLGSLGFMIGIVGFVAARIGAWWEHG